MKYHTILVSLDGNLTEDINWLTNEALAQGWILQHMTSTHQGVLLTFWTTTA